MIEDIDIGGGIPRLQHSGVHGGERGGHVVVAEVAEPRCGRVVSE